MRLASVSCDTSYWAGMGGGRRSPVVALYALVSRAVPGLWRATGHSLHNAVYRKPPVALSKA